MNSLVVSLEINTGKNGEITNMTSGYDSSEMCSFPEVSPGVRAIAWKWSHQKVCFPWPWRNEISGFTQWVEMSQQKGAVSRWKESCFLHNMFLVASTCSLIFTKRHESCYINIHGPCPLARLYGRNIHDCCPTVTSSFIPPPDDCYFIAMNPSPFSWGTTLHVWWLRTLQKSDIACWKIHHGNCFNHCPWKIHGNGKSIVYIIFSHFPNRWICWENGKNIIYCQL